MEAPEIETSRNFARQHPPLRQGQLAQAIAGRGARMTPLGRIGRVGAVGEPSELGGELPALVVSGLDAQGEATVEAAHQRALDATEVIEISNHAFGDCNADRRQNGGTAGRCIHEPARILLPVGAHEAAEQRDRRPFVAPTIRRDPR